MSTGGTYGYNPKVAHPNTIFAQMKSNTMQPDFFFGGSQVPINLGLPAHGNGLRSHYKPALTQMKQLSTQGRGLSNTYSRHSRIALPKHMSTIRQVI
jgi:hypothetical protein